MTRACEGCGTTIMRVRSLNGRSLCTRCRIEGLGGQYPGDGGDDDE